MYLKKIIGITALLLLCNVSGYAYSDEADDYYLNDDLDFIPIGDMPLRANCNFADQIVPVLNECGVIEILKENLFNKTNSLNKRSLLDYYDVLDSPFPENGQVSVNAMAFWNMIPKNKFTGGSSTIESYFGIANDSLISKIQQVFNNINTAGSECNEFFIEFLGLPPSMFNINIRELTGLFAIIKTQERRFGAMIDIKKSFKHWTIGFKMPLLIQIRNFFLSQHEADAIDEAAGHPPANQDQVNDFASSHLIADKAGLGDTRLFASFSPDFGRDDLQLQIGPFATAPTSLPFQKGIFGSQFPQQCQVPPVFDLCTILNLGLTPDALEHRLKHDFSILANEFIDRLSAMLLEDDLGNGKHWGLGFFLEPTLTFDNWSWHTRGSFEYLFPATESRFFTQDVDLSQFAERDFASRDPDIAEGNLRFLNTRLLAMFFPSSFEVAVRPGPIVMLTTDFTYQTNSWWFTAGNDLWYQAKEHIEFTVDQTGFDTCKVIKPVAFQYKIFGGISRAFYREHSGWLLSLKADKTVASSGIGKDYTVMLGATTTW